MHFHQKNLITLLYNSFCYWLVIIEYLSRKCHVIDLKCTGIFLFKWIGCTIIMDTLDIQEKIDQEKIELILVYEECRRNSPLMELQKMNAVNNEMAIFCAPYDPC